MEVIQVESAGLIVDDCSELKTAQALERDREGNLYHIAVLRARRNGEILSRSWDFIIRFCIPYVSRRFDDAGIGPRIVAAKVSDIGIEPKSWRVIAVGIAKLAWFHIVLAGAVAAPASPHRVGKGCDIRG